MRAVYSCFNIEEDIRKNSSSGGVYFLLAKYVIDRGGHVFAATYDKELNVKHIEIVSVDQIQETQGSKYVETILGDSFRRIKELLELGKEVLFVSTPCHCAGIRSFLSKEYENFICVDFVCQGIPSERVWHSYLEALRKRGHEVVRINMRDKGTGWSRFSYGFTYTDSQGKTITQIKDDNTYIKGYINCLYLRPSCYECNFKGADRTTDFTLGDCWGIWSVDPEFDDNKGVSLVLIHTSKGERIFELLKKQMIYKKREIEDFLTFNQCIVKSVSIPERRKVFFDKLQDRDFIDWVNKLTKISVAYRVKNKLVRLIRK